jgi:hypothetical protein
VGGRRQLSCGSAGRKWNLANKQIFFVGFIFIATFFFFFFFFAKNDNK